MDIGHDATFVRPGAASGDVSRARPFAGVEQAVAARATTIALARGRYDEPALLSGDLDVLAPCAQAITLSAGGRLVDFRGEVQGVHVAASGRSALTLERSDAHVRDVWLEASGESPALVHVEAPRLGW